MTCEETQLGALRFSQMFRTILHLSTVGMAITCCGTTQAQSIWRPYFFGAAGWEFTSAQSAAATASTGTFVPPPTTMTVPANTQGAYGGGAGAEALLTPIFGVSGEIEGLAPGQNSSSVVPTSSPVKAVGIASGNAYLHTKELPGDATIVPFWTLGYSVIFRDFAASAVNFGGGVRWWFGENTGLMAGARFTYAPSLQGVETKFLEIRVGIIFRH